MKTIVLLAEGTAAIMATIYFYKYKKTGFKYLMPYLWIMLAMENANEILNIPDFWQFVRWNLFGVFKFLLFSWMFSSEIRSQKYKSTIHFFMVAIVIFYLIEFALLGPATIYNYTRYAQDVLIIAIIALYAIDIFKRPQIERLDKDIASWISITFLIISVSFPVIQTAKIYYYGQEPLFTNLLWILTIIIVVMYSILSFGFIWSEKRS